MATYVQPTEIAARAGGRPLSESTTPSETDVVDWIDEAEAELLGTLASVGIGTSYAEGTRGFRVIRGWVGAYVAGLFRVSNAAAGGDGGNDDGERLVEAWRTLLERIRKDADQVGAMLDDSGVAPADSLRMASHLDDPALGLSDADVAPVFRIKGTHY